MGVPINEVIKKLLEYYKCPQPDNLKIYQKITGYVQNKLIYVDVSNIIYRIWYATNSDKNNLYTRRQIKENYELEKIRIETSGTEEEKLLLQIEKTKELNQSKKIIDDVHNFIISKYGLNPAQIMYVLDGKYGDEKKAEHDKRDASGGHDVVKIDANLKQYIYETCNGKGIKYYQCDKDETHKSGEADFKIFAEAITNAMNGNPCAVISNDGDYKLYPIISVTPIQKGETVIYDLSNLWPNMYNELKCTIEKKPFVYDNSIIEFMKNSDLIKHELFPFFIPTLIGFVLGCDYSNMPEIGGKIKGHGPVAVQKNLINDPYFYFKLLNKMNNDQVKGIKFWYCRIIENILAYLE